MKYSRILLDPKNSRWCYQRLYNFFSVFLNFGTIADNSGQSKLLIRSGRISYNWGKIFWLSQTERYLELIEKISCIVNYWLAGVSNYACNPTLVITKICMFSVYVTSVLLLKMRSQPGSAWTVNLPLHFIIVEATQNIFIYELAMLYIFYISIVCPYMRYANLFDFWFVITHWACFNFPIQIWAMKNDIALFLSSLLLRKSG